MTDINDKSRAELEAMLAEVQAALAAKDGEPDWGPAVIRFMERYIEAAGRGVLLIGDYVKPALEAALCDMIERYEQPPPDRKLLCAREAASRHIPAGGPETYEHKVAVRAIELWEEGFGK